MDMLGTSTLSIWPRRRGAARQPLCDAGAGDAEKADRGSLAEAVRQGQGPYLLPPAPPEAADQGPLQEQLLKDDPHARRGQRDAVYSLHSLLFVFFHFDLFHYVCDRRCVM